MNLFTYGLYTHACFPFEPLQICMTFKDIFPGLSRRHGNPAMNRGIEASSTTSHITITSTNTGSQVRSMCYQTLLLKQLKANIRMFCVSFYKSSQRILHKKITVISLWGLVPETVKKPFLAFSGGLNPISTRLFLLPTQQ